MSDQNYTIKFPITKCNTVVVAPSAGEAVVNTCKVWVGGWRQNILSYQSLVPQGLPSKVYGPCFQISLRASRKAHVFIVLI